MKKFLMALMLCLVSIMSFGQISTMTVEESRGYITVYKAPAGYGEIRYIRGMFILFGASDNRFEDSMHSIYLGNNKESAILSLEDLRKIVKKETPLRNTIVVKGFNDKNTEIVKVMGEIIFSTEYVAGVSHLFWAMRNDFENAKNAIENFNEI